MRNKKAQEKIRRVKENERLKSKSRQRKDTEKSRSKGRQLKIKTDQLAENKKFDNHTSDTIWDTIIIGAGAAGMTAALACRKPGQKVLLLERQSQMGRKILVTGNGRCNLTNFVQKEEYYRSNYPEKAHKILSVFGQADAMGLFRSLGIYTKDKDGYVYLYSEQAASVREAFETEIMSDSVITFLPESEVYDVWKDEKEWFHVTVKKVGEEQASFSKKQHYICKSLLITTGGLAGPKFGCDGSGYTFARIFGHDIIQPLPALTALKSAAPFLKKLSGVRNQAAITLKIDDKEVQKETGELQWTDYGISGVAIFQLSRFAVTALEQKKNVVLYFDFMPELSSEEKLRLFLNLAQNNDQKKVLSFIKGFFPSKLCPVILREAGIAEDKTIGSLKKQEWDTLVMVVSQFSLRINGYMGYEKAQVTRGGVSLAELNDSLESILQPGLFFAGEVVDVDGTCGGYNLQWAFSSGTVAGRAIVERNQELSQNIPPVTEDKEGQSISERKQSK